MIKHLKHTKYQKKLVTASDPLTEKKLLKSTYTRPYFTIAHDSQLPLMCPVHNVPPKTPQTHQAIQVQLVDKPILLEKDSDTTIHKDQVINCIHWSRYLPVIETISSPQKQCQPIDQDHGLLIDIEQQKSNIPLNTQQACHIQISLSQQNKKWAEDCCHPLQNLMQSHYGTSTCDNVLHFLEEMKEILQCDQEQLQRTKHELQCRFMGNIREQASRLHKMLIEVVNCFVQEWEEVQIRQFVNVDQLVYCGQIQEILSRVGTRIDELTSKQRVVTQYKQVLCLQRQHSLKQGITKKKLTEIVSYDHEDTTRQLSLFARQIIAKTIKQQNKLLQDYNYTRYNSLINKHKSELESYFRSHIREQLT